VKAEEAEETWEPLETQDPDEPIKNSTGWRISSYPRGRTESEEGECETSHFRSYPMVSAAYEYPTPLLKDVRHEEYGGPYGMGTSTYPMGGYTPGGSYIPIENKLAVVDLTQESSGSEYVPKGKPYTPQKVRKTPQPHGWIPGRYTEK
jgi:hypothetical protein